MAKKTAIRRGFKYLPISTEKISKALELDAEHDEPRQIEYAQESSAHPHTRTQAALAKLAGQTAAPEEAPPGESFSIPPIVDAVPVSAPAHAAETIDAATGEVQSHLEQRVAPPDVSGADAEPAGDEAALIRESELRDALSQPWETVERVLADAGVEGGMTKHAAQAAIRAHVKLVLGKAGKEASIPLPVRRAMYDALREGRMGSDGKIAG
jgi:hypothetical protein